MIPHYPGYLYSAGKSAGRQRRGVTVAAVYSRDDGGRWARERPAASPAIDASLTELTGRRTMELKAAQLKVIQKPLKIWLAGSAWEFKMHSCHAWMWKQTLKHRPHSHS